MSKPLPVFFHIGRDLTLKTRARKGWVAINGASIRLWDQHADFDFSGNQLQGVSLIRLHAIGSVIKVDLGSEYLFMSVTRLMIGQIALINYFATIRLFEAISAIAAEPSSSEFPPRRPRSAKRRLAIFALSALLSFSLMAVLSLTKRSWH